MTRARLKTEVQDVWQFRLMMDQMFDAPVWVINCTEERNDGLYLVRGADKQRIEIGDWLIREDGAPPMWSTDEDFRRQYEVVAAFRNAERP